MKVLSLFSGGGLGDYGLELAGMQIVGQVEIDHYCQKILKLRWPDVPKWTDIKNVRGEEVLEQCGAVDLISGGFPCQPFSSAHNTKSKGGGKEDNRYLWPEMFRLISEIRPTWVLAENVPGIIRFALDDVCSDLESQGYETLSIVFPAHALGANHKRDRLWIIGNSGSVGRPRLQQLRKDAREIEARREGIAGSANEQLNDSLEWRTWPIKPFLRREDDGFANRVDRLKLLGNGQVVQVVEWIGRRIMEFNG